MLNNIIAIVIVIMSIILFRSVSNAIKEERHNNEIVQDQWAWINHGLRQDWIRSYCATHDLWTTHEEELLYDEVDDPCITIFRLIYTD